MIYKNVYFGLLWYFIVLLVFLIAIYPIYSVVQLNYPFYGGMFYFVFLSGISVHLLFFLEYTSVAKCLLCKVGIIFLVPFILFLLIDSYLVFVAFGQELGYQSLMQNLNPERQIGLTSYVRNSTLIFATISIIGVGLIPIKMIRSIWKQKKYVDYGH